MKKLIYLFLLSLAALQADAQQMVPEIKAGTKIDYRYFLYGQSSTVIGITVNTLTDSVELGWNIRGYAYGKYLISAEGFKNGTKINFIQPAHQTTLRLAADETFDIISKKAFQELKKNRKFFYNNTTYALVNDAKEETFKIGEQQIDVLHVKGVEEAGDLWILNRPDFPLICQIRNNPLGINFTVTAIRQD